MGLLDFLKGRPETRGAQLVAAFVREVGASPHLVQSLASIPTGRAVIDAELQVRVEALRAGIQMFGRAAASHTQWRELLGLQALVGGLLRSRPALTADDLRSLIESAASTPAIAFHQLPLGSIIGAAERFAGDTPLDDELAAALKKLAQRLHAPRPSAGHRRLLLRIDTLLGKMAASPTFDRGDAWAQVVLSDLGGMGSTVRDAWLTLFALGAADNSARPSKRWMTRAREVVQNGVDDFQTRAIAWFAAVQAPRTPVRILAEALTNPGIPSPLMREPNAAQLRAVVWASSLFGDRDLAQAVGDLGLVCFKKIPMHGAYSNKLGNACVYALGAMPGQEGVAQLGRLRMKVKYTVAQRLLERAFDEAARRAGLPREDLEELAVPTFGLGADGVLREEMGGFTAELRLTGTTSAEIRWFTAEGKLQKSVPAEVRRECAEDLKELKKAVKDIETQLPAQRDRLERLLLTGRTLPYPLWRERYLEHPLIGHMARRLIWRLGDQLGTWHEGQLVNPLGRPLDQVTPQTPVRLWHPLGSDPGVVLEWRTWLVAHDVSQPFKQAHREIYVLTDAERETDIYSNRFAAHVLRQHVFAALCRERGWRYHLQGQWDSHNVPTLLLPSFDLQAEFWVESPANQGDTSEMGIYLYVTTDQVRFCRPGGAPEALEHIPPLVLSEVMRDVDLFVAVTSVGADPEWYDRGPAGVQTYWREFSFGALSATAETRRAILEALVPKLKIASRCRIDGRFLVVRGGLRTYKIHLGSGNILMEPNDQYLCIVPGPGSRDAAELRVPFEGDRTLSIIVSKAFLLADDKAIKDPTIVRQIKHP